MGTAEGCLLARVLKTTGVAVTAVDLPSGGCNIDLGEALGSGRWSPAPAGGPRFRYQSPAYEGLKATRKKKGDYTVGNPVDYPQTLFGEDPTSIIVVRGPFPANTLLISQQQSQQIDIYSFG